MDFSLLLAMFLLTTPRAVVLLVCTGVGGLLVPHYFERVSCRDCFPTVEEELPIYAR